ncbi:hypothetical protein SAMN04489712_104346 [Thermomonospora echinospora]|uniref:Uncharacterized protein n=1 Tax=Thermomonospora echinospora TaxID=1992 RepID=A0A1H5Z3Y1_9ACTN|nr:hypothetical protein [Thermomonospora echinospora]SEG31223.1 hypothetical protein SAMN04489712_104346 [Thermomonospora echinospora]
MAKALADPLVRVGSIHHIKPGSLYEAEVPGGIQLAVFTFSWMEPGPDPVNGPPNVVAMNLHVPATLLHIAHRELAQLNPCPQRARRR